MQNDVNSPNTGGILAGRSEAQLKDVWFFLFWNPDKSDNILTSLVLDLCHWMNENKGHTEQLLPLLQFSKRQIYQATQSSESPSRLHLVTVQASDGRTARLPCSNQYTDGYQIGVIIHWREVVFSCWKRLSLCT